MKYKIVYECDLSKTVQKYPRKDAIRIKETIEELAFNPRPQHAIKLKGHNIYRARCGNYRIIYGIKDKELVVLIIDIEPRKDAYRGL